MTNALRGQVALPCGSAIYTLEFTIDALCQLEDRLGTTAREILARIQADDSLTFLRTLLWGALREHHAALTERAAGELIRSAGGGTAVTEKVLEAFLAAFPKQGGGAGGEASPQSSPETAGADGTGSTSSGSGAS
jgi:hypothetical protein